MSRAHTTLVVALMARQGGSKKLVGSHIFNLDNTFELGPVGVPRCGQMTLGNRVKRYMFVCRSVSTYLAPLLLCRSLFLPYSPLLSHGYTAYASSCICASDALETHRNIRSQSLILLLALPSFSFSVRCVGVHAREHASARNSFLHENC